MHKAATIGKAAASSWSLFQKTSGTMITGQGLIYCPKPFTTFLPRLRLSALRRKSGTTKHHRYMIMPSKVKFYTQR